MSTQTYDSMIVDKLGGEVTSQYSKNIKVDCPNCGSRKLYVHRTKGMCHCFKCEYSASAVGLISDLEGCSYIEALKYVEDMSHRGSIDVIRKSGDTITEHIIAAILGIEDEVLEGVSTELPIGCVKLKGTDGERYLNSRGYLTRKVEDFNLLYCDSPQPEGRLNTEGHIIFPDYDPMFPETVRFWTSRITWEPRGGETKSFHSPGIDKVCYGLWAVPMQQKGIIVVEGPLDALACGVGNAVAILGSSITDAQLLELSSRFTWAVVCLDAEAWEENLGVARRLKSVGIESWCTFLIEGDPGDLIKGDGWRKNKRLLTSKKGISPAKLIKKIAQRYSVGLEVKVRLEKRKG